MKPILFLCIAVVVFLLIAGCTQTAQPGQPAATAAVTATPTIPAGTATATPVVPTTTSILDNTVIIQNMAFNPAQITVKAGSIVRWVNKDKVFPGRQD